MVHWCSTWQLALNISKCLYTRFGLANKPSFNYSISGTALLQVTSVNDLGVLFDTELDFSAQCHKIAAKGYSHANMILKCFYSKDRSLLCKLFCTFVRPVLEYNSLIWSPHYIKDIKTIEKVQKYFTKNLKGLHNKSYNERLSILNLPSLECRRAYADIVFLYKICNGMCDPSLQILFKTATSVTNTNTVSLRRHPLQFYLPKPRSDLLKFSFCYRTVKLWNNLPENICKAPSIAMFKNLLLTHLCKIVVH